jgi:lysozyme
MTTAYLAADIARDEGCRLCAYQDTLGVWTVGYGHAHVPPGTVWTQAQADDQLAADIARAAGLLDAHIPWWRGLADPRQDVLANMTFNLGWLSRDGRRGLGAFHTTLALIKAGDYAAAAAHMLSLPWAHQVGARAARLSAQMRSGQRAGADAAGDR